MSHYDSCQWADFVRGLIGGQTRASMKAHLASGCRRCGKMASLFSKVAAVAAEESNYEAPAHVIRGIRAAYALQQPEEVRVLPRIIGRLIYDSFREPLPVGMRSRHRLTRQALYQAAHFSLDLRLECHPGSAGVTLVGQVANEREPANPPAGLPVFLRAGRRVVARALSNKFGEFQLTYQPERHLRLYIQANQELGKRIEVPMSRFSRHVSAAKRPPRPSDAKSD